jgi:DNA-binding Xre family transcriptional regulator
VAVKWNLKKWLAVNHDIYRPSELQALLVERVGVQLSLQALSALINNKPHALRIQTIQALCDALNCKLSDFCDILPDPRKAQLYQLRKVAGSTPSRLYGGKTLSEIADKEEIFPDPRLFRNDKSESD